MKPKIDRSWKLPAPKRKEPNRRWFSIARAGPHIPWGYEQNPYSQAVLDPIPEHLNLLEEAKNYLGKKYSYRDVAAWLSHESGTPISAAGLRTRLQRESKNKRAVATAKFWANQTLLAQKEAERLERQVGVNYRDDPSGVRTCPCCGQERTPGSFPTESGASE